MIARFILLEENMKETKNIKTVDTKQVGNLTELQCITRFYELGYSVSIPYGDSEKYDFILDINGNLYRIQCKHATMHEDEFGEIDYISIDTTWQTGYSRGANFRYHAYTKKDIDYFVTHYNGKNYLVSVDDCNTQKILRILPPKNNQSKGVNYLLNYLDEKVCIDLM